MANDVKPNYTQFKVTPTALDDGIALYDSRPKHNYGLDYFQRLERAEDDSLTGGYYSLGMSAENTRLLARKAAPGGVLIDYGSHKHNLVGIADNLKDAGEALTYRVFKGQTAYGDAINQLSNAVGVGDIYKTKIEAQKDPSSTTAGRVANALTYGAIGAAATGVASSLAIKAFNISGKNGLVVSAISALIGGALAGIAGYAGTAPYTDDYGAKKLKSSFDFAERSVSTLYKQYADTGEGLPIYNQLLGAVPALGAAAAAHLTTLAIRRKGIGGKAGLALYGSAALLGALLGGTGVGTLAKYGIGERPERGKLVPGTVASKDHVVREFGGDQGQVKVTTSHYKEIVAQDNSWGHVATGNLSDMERSAAAAIKNKEGTQLNLGFSFTNPKYNKQLNQFNQWARDNVARTKRGEKYLPPPELENFIVGGFGGNSGDKMTKLITESKGALWTAFPYATSDNFFNSLMSEIKEGREMHLMFQNPFSPKAGGNQLMSADRIQQLADMAIKSGNKNVHIYLTELDSNILGHLKVIKANNLTAAGSDNNSTASRTTSTELTFVTENGKISLGTEDYLKYIAKEYYKEINLSNPEGNYKTAFEQLKGKNQYDRGVLSTLYRPVYSLKDTSSLTSQTAQQAAGGRLPGVVYLPNAIPDGFYTENRGARPTLYQNWFYSMTGTLPEGGTLASKLLRQADAQMNPRMSFNPLDNRGWGALLNEAIGNDLYTEGQGLVGTGAKAIGRGLDLVTGYYAMKRIHQLRTGQTSEGDVKSLHKDQYTALNDRGFFETSLFMAQDAIKSTAGSLLFYFGFSHTLSLARQHMETIGMNTILQTLDQVNESGDPAQAISARRQQLGKYLPIQQLNLLEASINISSTTTEDLLKSQTKIIDTVFDTAAKNALIAAKVDTKIIGSIVDDAAIKALTPHMDTTTGRYNLGEYTSQVQSRISSALADLDITADSTEPQVKSALEKVFKDKFSYVRGQEMGLSSPIVSDTLKSSEIGRLTWLGNLRRIDRSNYSQALRPILETIAVTANSNQRVKLNEALDAFGDLISRPPTIVLNGDKISFANYGMERLEDVAKGLDVIANYIPANPFFYVPQIREAFGVNDLHIAEDNADISLKSFLGSGGFEEMINTQRNVFRGITNMWSAGVTNELKTANWLFRQNKVLAAKEELITNFLAENTGALDDAAQKQLKGYLTDYQENTKLFTARVKSSNRSLSSNAEQLSAYAGARKTLIGLGAVLLADKLVDRYLMQNEGRDLFNQVGTYIYARSLNAGPGKDIDSVYADGGATDSQALYQTEFKGTVPTYLRAPIITAGYFIGRRLAYESVEVDISKVVKEDEIAKVTKAFADEKVTTDTVRKLFSSRLKVKGSNKGAYFGAITAILGTQIAFNVAATVINTSLNAWNREGLKMQSESAIAVSKISTAIQNTMRARRLQMGDEKASDLTVVENMPNAERAQLVIATMIREGITKSETEGYKPQYTFATQIPNPVFQLAFVGKLDPTGQTISVGGGFQFLPLLGSGSIPAMPLSLRIKPRGDKRDLVAINNKQVEEPLPLGFKIASTAGRLTSALLFDPNSQMTSALGVVAAANLIRTVMGKIEPDKLKMQAAAEAYEGVKPLGNMLRVGLNTAESAIRWSQAPMMAAPNSTFKAAMSLFASNNRQYPALLGRMGKGSRLAATFMFPAIFGMAAMSKGSSFEYIGSGYETFAFSDLASDDPNADSTEYAKALTEARIYRAGGVVGTAAMYGTSLQIAGAFKAAKDFSSEGGVNQRALREIYEQSVLRFFNSQAKNHINSGGLLGSMTNWEDEVAQNATLDTFDTVIRKRVLNEMDSQEAVIDTVFKKAGISSYHHYGRGGKQKYITDKVLAALQDSEVKEAIELSDSAFGQAYKALTAEAKADSTKVLNLFTKHADELTTIKQGVEPSMYRTAPKRFGLIATAIAVPYLILSMGGHMLSSQSNQMDERRTGNLLEAFSKGVVNIPMLVASGVAPEARMTPDEKKQIANYRKIFGIAAAPPTKPKTMGEIVSGYAAMANPLNFFNIISGYRDNPKEFVNIFGPVGASMGAKGWSHYTQVQSTAADASMSRYYMQAAMFAGSDKELLKAINLITPTNVAGVVNLSQAKLARKTPSRLKGTATSSERQAVAGTSRELQMALEQREMSAKRLSYKWGDEVARDVLLQMIGFGRVANTVAGDVKVVNDYLGWTPFDTGLPFEMLISPNFEQPSEALKAVDTMNSAFRGMANWLATGDFKDQMDFSLINRVQRSQTSSGVPIVSTFTDMLRYVSTGIQDPKTNQANPLGTLATLSAVTAFTAVLGAGSVASVYLGLTSAAAAVAAYKEGGDALTTMNNVADNIEQLSKPPFTVFGTSDNRLMMGTNRVMHRGGYQLLDLNDELVRNTLGPNANEIANNLKDQVITINTSLKKIAEGFGGIAALEDADLLQAVSNRNSASVVHNIRQRIKGLYDVKTLGDAYDLTELLKFQAGSFDEFIEDSVHLNNLQSELESIFDNKRGFTPSNVQANARQAIAKTLLDVRQSIHSQLGELDTTAQATFKYAPDKTGPDDAFRARLLASESTPASRDLGKMVETYGVGGTLGKGVMGLGSIASGYFDFMQYYSLASSITALGKDNREDRLAAAYVVGDSFTETVMPWLVIKGITQSFKKAPGRAGAAGAALLAATLADQYLFKGELWRSTKKVYNFVDKQVMNRIDNFFGGVAKAASEQKIIRGLLSPLGTPFRTIDPMLTSMHQSVEGTGWASITMFLLPHTVDSKLAISPRTMQGMQTAWGARQIEVGGRNGVEVRNRLKSIADQRANAALYSFSNRPDELMVNAELQGGFSTVSGQVFSDIYLDNKGYIDNRVLSDFGVRSQMSGLMTVAAGARAQRAQYYYANRVREDAEAPDASVIGILETVGRATTAEGKPLMLKAGEMSIDAALDVSFVWSGLTNEAGKKIGRLTESILDGKLARALNNKYLTNALALGAIIGSAVMAGLSIKDSSEKDVKSKALGFAFVSGLGTAAAIYGGPVVKKAKAIATSEGTKEKLANVGKFFGPVATGAIKGSKYGLGLIGFGLAGGAMTGPLVRLADLIKDQFQEKDTELPGWLAPSIFIGTSSITAGVAFSKMTKSNKQLLAESNELITKAPNSFARAGGRFLLGAVIGQQVGQLAAGLAQSALDFGGLGGWGAPVGTDKSTERRGWFIATGGALGAASMAGIFAKAPTIIDGFVDSINNISEFIGGKLGRNTKGVSGDGGWLKAIKTVWNWMLEPLRKVSYIFTKTTKDSPMWNFIKQTLSPVITKIKSHVTPAIDQAKMFASTQKQALKRFAGQIKTNLGPELLPASIDIITTGITLAQLQSVNEESNQTETIAVGGNAVNQLIHLGTSGIMSSVGLRALSSTLALQSTVTETFSEDIGRMLLEDEMNPEQTRHTKQILNVGLGVTFTSVMGLRASELWRGANNGIISPAAAGRLATGSDILAAIGSQAAQPYLRSKMRSPSTARHYSEKIEKMQTQTAASIMFSAAVSSGNVTKGISAVAMYGMGFKTDTNTKLMRAGLIGTRHAKKAAEYRQAGQVIGVAAAALILAKTGNMSAASKVYYGAAAADTVGDLGSNLYIASQDKEKSEDPSNIFGDIAQNAFILLAPIAAKYLHRQLRNFRTRKDTLNYKTVAGYGYDEAVTPEMVEKMHGAAQTMINGKGHGVGIAKYLEGSTPAGTVADVNQVPAAPQQTGATNIPPAGSAFTYDGKQPSFYTKGYVNYKLAEFDNAFTVWRGMVHEAVHHFNQSLGVNDPQAAVRLYRVQDRLAALKGKQKVHARTAVYNSMQSVLADSSLTQERLDAIKATAEGSADRRRLVLTALDELSASAADQTEVLKLERFGTQPELVKSAILFIDKKEFDAAVKDDTRLSTLFSIMDSEGIGYERLLNREVDELAPLVRKGIAKDRFVLADQTNLKYNARLTEGNARLAFDFAKEFGQFGDEVQFRWGTDADSPAVTVDGDFITVNKHSKVGMQTLVRSIVREGSRITAANQVGTGDAYEALNINERVLSTPPGTSVNDYGARVRAAESAAGNVNKFFIDLTAEGNVSQLDASFRAVGAGPVGGRFTYFPNPQSFEAAFNGESAQARTAKALVAAGYDILQLDFGVEQVVTAVEEGAPAIRQPAQPRVELKTTVAGPVTPVGPTTVARPTTLAGPTTPTVTGPTGPTTLGKLKGPAGPVGLKKLTTLTPVGIKKKGLSNNITQAPATPSQVTPKVELPSSAAPTASTPIVEQVTPSVIVEPPAPTTSIKPVTPSSSAAGGDRKQPIVKPQPTVEAAQGSVVEPVQRAVNILPNNLITVGASQPRVTGLLPSSITQPGPTISQRRLQAQQRLDASATLSSSQQPIITPAIYEGPVTLKPQTYDSSVVNDVTRLVPSGLADARFMPQYTGPVTLKLQQYDLSVTTNPLSQAPSNLSQARFITTQPDIPFTPRLLGQGQFGYAYTTSTDTVRKVMFSSMFSPKEAAIQSYAGELGVAPKVKDVYMSMDEKVNKPFLSAIDMDYVEGKTFMGPSMTMDQRRASLAQVAQLHAHGIIHGDLHSQNVLMTDNGQVKIIDYGQAFSVNPQFDKPDFVARSKQAELDKFLVGLPEDSPERAELTQYYQQRIDETPSSIRFSPSQRLGELQTDASVITKEQLAPEGIQKAAAFVEPTIIPKVAARPGLGVIAESSVKAGVKAGLADIGVQASRKGIKFSGGQFKASQLGKVNLLTTGLDVGVTVIEGAARGDSWGTTAKKAGGALLTGLAFGALMQGAVAGITAGLAAAGAAGAAAVFSTVIVPIAVIGLLAYGAYDTVTRLGKAYGDYKKKNKLSDADVRDNVVKGINDFFVGDKPPARKPVKTQLAPSQEATAKPAPTRPAIEFINRQSLSDKEVAEFLKGRNITRDFKGLKYDLPFYNKNLVGYDSTTPSNINVANYYGPLAGKNSANAKGEGYGLYYDKRRKLLFQVDTETNTVTQVFKSESKKTMALPDGAEVIHTTSPGVTNVKKTISEIESNNRKVVGIIGHGFIGTGYSSYRQKDGRYKETRIDGGLQSSGIYTDAKGKYHIVHGLTEEKLEQLKKEKVKSISLFGIKMAESGHRYNRAFLVTTQKDELRYVYLPQEVPHEQTKAYIQKQVPNYKDVVQFDGDTFAGYSLTDPTTGKAVAESRGKVPYMWQQPVFLTVPDKSSKNKKDTKLDSKFIQEAVSSRMAELEKEMTDEKLKGKGYSGLKLKAVKALMAADPSLAAGVAYLYGDVAKVNKADLLNPTILDESVGKPIRKIMSRGLSRMAQAFGDVLSNIPLIGDFFFPKKAAASDLSLLNRNVNTKQRQLKETQALLKKDKKGDDAFSKEYADYADKVEPGGGFINNFFKGIKEFFVNIPKNIKKGVDKATSLANEIAAMLRGGFNWFTDTVTGGGAISSFGGKGWESHWIEYSKWLQQDSKLSGATGESRAGLAFALILGQIETGTHPRFKTFDSLLTGRGDDRRMVGALQIHTGQHGNLTPDQQRRTIAGWVTGTLNVPTSMAKGGWDTNQGRSGPKFNNELFYEDIRSGVIHDRESLQKALKADKRGGRNRYNLNWNDWQSLNDGLYRLSEAKVDSLIQYVKEGGDLTTALGSSSDKQASDVSSVVGGVRLDKSYITSPQGLRGGRQHKGVDVNSMRDGKNISGAYISFTRGGVVEKVAYQDGKAGHYFVVRFDDGTIRKAFHLLNRPNIKEGQRFEAGQVLGQVGNTGRSTGPHLHYEAWSATGKLLQAADHIGDVVLSRQTKVTVNQSNQAIKPLQNKSSANSNTTKSPSNAQTTSPSVIPSTDPSAGIAPTSTNTNSNIPLGLLQSLFPNHNANLLTAISNSPNPQLLRRLGVSGLRKLQQALKGIQSGAQTVSNFVTDTYNTITGTGSTNIGANRVTETYITEKRGASDQHGGPRGGRKHAGQDFNVTATTKSQTYLGGIITRVAYQAGNNLYNNYIDIYNPQLNVVERIAEFGSPKYTQADVGKTIAPGAVVGVGSTSGPSVVHREIRNDMNAQKQGGFGYKGTLDPLEFLQKHKIVRVEETVVDGVKAKKVIPIGSPNNEIAKPPKPTQQSVADKLPPVPQPPKETKQSKAPEANLDVIAINKGKLPPAYQAMVEVFLNSVAEANEATTEQVRKATMAMKPKNVYIEKPVEGDADAAYKSNKEHKAVDSNTVVIKSKEGNKITYTIAQVESEADSQYQAAGHHAFVDFDSMNANQYAGSAKEVG